MRKTLVKDSDYEQAINEIGFCVLPLFSANQIAEIKGLYEHFSTSNSVNGLIASHSKTDPKTSMQISNNIQAIVMPSLEKWFDNFYFFIGGFMVKGANTTSAFPLHQDWNIVDETKFTSYQIWIPLELSEPNNGGMIVLPGSHQFYKNNRSGSYGMPRIETDEKLSDLSVSMIVPKGSALIYHNSLFHASYPNSTNADRISAIINIYQNDAVLEYAHKDSSKNRTEKYGINNFTFLSHLNTFEKGNVPDELPLLSIDSVDSFDNSLVQSSDLVSRYNKTFPQGKEAFEPLQLHILKENFIEEQLKRDGYITLDFIDEQTVRNLVVEYEKFFLESNNVIGRFTPMEHSTPESKRYIHNFILSSIREKLDFYFKDYQTPIASYFTKYANSAGDLSWHHDASILLNTHLEPHYGIWCPLINVDANNGAFCLIEKSHKFAHSIFLSGMHWPFSKYTNQFNEVKKVISLKAGQMVLFDLRLIHHAMPNTSSKDRVVICARLTHQKSKYYSFKTINETDQSINVFEEQQNYYLRDDWSTENQAANQTKLVGSMTHIYDNINYSTAEKALANKNK